MKTKLKAMVALSLFFLMTFWLTLVALAGTAKENDNLHRNHENSLTPGKIGLMMTTIHVSTTVDGLNDGDGQCSLREAVAAATNDAPVDGGACPAGSLGHDLIMVPSGLYLLTDDINITSNLTIQGAGSANTIIDDLTGFQTRMFDIKETGVVTIADVTINGGDDFTGGGLRNEGILLLEDSIVSNNTAFANGGGIFNDGSGSHVGILTIKRVTFTGNEARIAGGGIFNEDGIVTINNSQISNNTALTTSTAGVGGGIANLADGSNSTITINQSAITDNTANGAGGGGISNSADTNRTATIVLNQTEVSNNRATSTSAISTTGFGGGIRNGFVEGVTGVAASIVTLDNSMVRGNTAFNGGGIASGSTSPMPTLILGVTLNDSTVSGNTATHNNGNNDGVGNGGGLLNQDGLMTVVNSTISGNTAEGGTGLVSGYGGGFLNTSIGSPATLWLTNTTVASNTATVGVGVANAEGLAFDATTNFKNSIIGGGCANPNPAGTLTSNGYNLEEGSTTTCNLTAIGDFTSTNLGLGLLQKQQPSDGTVTHTPLQGSPAIDSGICNGAPPKDQRAKNRPNAISDFCDIGAVESSLLGVADLEIVKVVTPTQADPGQAITYTLTFINNGPAWAGDVVITDEVPLTVTGVASTSSGVAITATTGVTYSWTLGDLARGANGTITITGLISPNVTTSTSFINTALIANVNDTDSDNAKVNIGDVPEGTYLPIIMKNS